ncbi:MAG: hypothetical protein L6R41_001026 [Letrouitia leprolyta]|nr:MAG: hypothetical protein L6R41_001026 [Letrouitia leprolyta]
MADRTEQRATPILVTRKLSALEEARLIISRPSVAAFFAKAENPRQTPAKRLQNIDTAIAGVGMFIPGNDTLVDSPLMISSSSSRHQSGDQFDTKPSSFSNEAHRHQADASVGDPAAKALPVSHPGSIALEEVPLASRSDSVSSTGTSFQYSSSCIAQDSASDADNSSVNESPISPASKHRYRRPSVDRRAIEKGVMTLGDVCGYELTSRMTYLRPRITLRQYINFVIGHDITLPTEDEMGGDHDWNAAECEYASSIPLESEPFFMKDEFDVIKKPPFGDDLAIIGAPSLYEDDAVTEKVRKQIGAINLPEPRRPANVEAESVVEKMKAKKAPAGLFQDETEVRHMDARKRIARIRCELEKFVSGVDGL